MGRFDALNDLAQESVQPESIASTGKAGRPAGRVGGKSSDEAYTKTSILVRKDTLNRVDMRLLQEEQAGKRKADRSVLIEELLQNWLSVT